MQAGENNFREREGEGDDVLDSPRRVRTGEQRGDGNESAHPIGK